MGQRELLLTLGAMVMFATAMLTVNQNVVRSSEAIYDQQVEYVAMYVAQGYIEEAKTKAYDEKVIEKEKSINDAGDFSGTLKKEGGESYPNYFDDVDDFNDLSMKDTVMTIPVQIDISVDYVHDSNLETPLESRQYFKKMRVQVGSPYLNLPVTAQYIFAYQKNQ